MFGADGSTAVDLNPVVGSGGLANGAAYTVPAEILFHGDYKRAGSDLKITGQDGSAFVVHDYFKSDHLHTLYAPDGAALTGDIVAALAGPLAPGQYAQATAPQGAGEAIGRVATLQGGAVAVRNGVAVTLNVGDAVMKGDVVQTQGNSAVGVIFADGSTFDLGANARMVLNEFVYDPSATSGNSSVINLVQGSITFIAGQVAHTGDMKVGTPVATMGIRGTAVHVDIDVNLGTTQVSLLFEPALNRAGSFEMYSLSGKLIANVIDVNGKWTVTPTAPLDAIATEALKTPTEMAQALTAVQVAFNTQQLGQTLLNAQPLPGQPSAPQGPQGPQQQQPQNLQGPDNQTPQHPTQTTPKTQIASTDTSQTKVTVNATEDNSGTTTQVVVNNQSSGTNDAAPPPPPPPPQVYQPPPPPANLPPFFEAAPTTLVRVEASDHDGQPINAIGPQASADGRYIAFVGADTLPTVNNQGADGFQDVFLYDRLTGNAKSLTDVLVGTALHAGETFTSLPSISGDGHYVVFDGKYQATQTVDGQTVTYEAKETFIYDGHTGITTLLTANGGQPSISGNGDYVAVVATQFATVPAGEGTATIPINVVEIFDRASGQILDQIAVGAAEQQANSGQTDPGIRAPSISADGHYLTFETTASSVDIGYDLNTATEHFDLGGNGQAQIYIFDLTHPTVAPQLVSFATGGGGANGNSGNIGVDQTWPASMSADGKFVVFESDATNLVAGGTAAGQTNVYLLDVANHHISLISAEPTGADSNGDSLRPQISSDGRFITYVSTSSDLIANGADTNHQTDVFLYDTHTGSTTLITNGYDGDSEWGTSISSLTGGIVVGFGSQADNAVTPDTNNKADIFVLDNTAQNTGTIVDDAAQPTLTTTGVLKFTDEANDHHTVTLDQGQHYGALSFSIQDTGPGDEGVLTWTYTVDQSVAAQLGQNNTLTDNFTVTLTDSANNVATAIITVNIVGGNGELTGDSSGAVITDFGAGEFGATTSGHLVAATSFAAGDSIVWSATSGNNGPPGAPQGVVIDTYVTPQTLAYGHYGYLQVDQSGNWTYQLFNDLPQVGSLAVGQVATETFAIEATNSTGGIETKIITVDVTGGANQPAVIHGTIAGGVTEAGGVNNSILNAPTATGTLTDADIDNQANTFLAVAAGAASDHHYGTYAMSAGGTWTYTLDNSNPTVQALNAGSAPLTDSFTVLAQDGTAQQVTITINGANDAAVVSGTAAGSVMEAGGVNNTTPGTPTATGTLTDLDPDNTANTFQAVAAGTASDNHYGTYAMTADGTWTYTLDNSNPTVQALNTNSAPLTDTFTVLTQDGTAQQVTITINGANDAVLVAAADAFSTTEAQIEQAQAASKLVVGNVLDNDSAALAVTAVGVPIVTGGPAGLQILGIHSETASSGEAAQYGITTNYGEAHLAVGNDGQVYLWSSSGDDPFRPLGSNDAATINFSYTVGDGHGGSDTSTVAITVDGTNDPAFVFGTKTGSVTETGVNSNVTPDKATGTLSDTDFDNPFNTFQPVTAATASANGFGAFTIDASGHWAYLLDNTNAAVQALTNGQTLSDNFTVHTQDGTAQKVTVTIHGPGNVQQQQDVADGTLTNAASTDHVTITPWQDGGYNGTSVTGASNGHGGFDWHFNASISELTQQAGVTQTYSITDTTHPSAATTLSVSIGGPGGDQFNFSPSTGAHMLVNFTTTVDSSGHYIGDSVNLQGFTSGNDQHALVLADVLADLTTDSHGNAVVNLGAEGSLTFAHVSQTTVQQQAEHIFKLAGGGVV